MITTPDQIARLNRLRRRLCWESPVLAPGLAALQIRPSKLLPTAAVSGRGVVYANEGFFAAKRDSHCTFVILHELMHVMLRHHERIAGRIPLIWNIAGDLVINEAIPALGLNENTRSEFVTVPDDCLWRERDAPWIPAGLTTEATYDHLMKRAEEEIEKLAAAGQVGVGCGVISDDEAERNERENGDNTGGVPAGAEGLSPAEWRAITHTIEASARGSAGREAAALKSLLHRPPARVPWGSLIRQLAAQASSRLGRDFTTWSRRSRRSPRGIVLPGARALETALAIVIDASGSVSDDDLSHMVAETRAAVDATGVPAFLVVHDAAVFSAGWIHPAAPFEEVAKHIGGRGGTRFEPAYERISDEKRAFAACVHFTDGVPCEPWPSKPDNCKVAVAAITPQGTDELVPVGWRKVPIEGPRKAA